MTQVSELSLSLSGAWKGIQGAVSTVYGAVSWVGNQTVTVVQNAWKAVSPLFAPMADAFPNPIGVAVTLGFLSGGLMWYANSENNEIAKAAAQASSLAAAIGLGAFLVKASLI